MKLENEFKVKAPIDDTWGLLLDMERVAGCLPGATVESSPSDGDYHGQIRVKLGPMTVTYKGSLRLTEVDNDAHRAIIEVRAKELKGQGTATAVIHNELAASSEDLTGVRVQTDLTVTGRPAQLGRGIMQEVAANMLEEFARNLEGELGTDTRGDRDDAERSISAQEGDGHSTSARTGTGDAFDVGTPLYGAVRRRAIVALVVLLLIAVVLRTRKRTT